MVLVINGPYSDSEHVEPGHPERPERLTAAMAGVEDLHLGGDLVVADGDAEALRVNGLDREKLRLNGQDPKAAMTAAGEWIASHSAGGRPVLVAYPLSFDWTWLYWYFVQFSEHGSPFDHSRCFDLKTAFAVKAKLPIASAGRSKVPANLRGTHRHTHHALDDAIEQAELFANIFEWNNP